MTQDKKAPEAKDAPKAKPKKASAKRAKARPARADAPEAGLDQAVKAEEAAAPEAAAEETTEATVAEAAADAKAGEAAEASVAEAAAPADEVAELKDRLLRAMAETENVRRRAARDREDASKYAVTGFARDILPVIDNLRRALDSVPEEARNEAPIASLVAGVEMTERELLGAFERHGIRRIDPMGERFDHNLHQAVFEVDDPQTPPGTIVEVVQPGYVIADRLLRPAMVGVAKGADAPPAVDTEA